MSKSEKTNKEKKSNQIKSKKKVIHIKEKKVQSIDFNRFKK